MIELKERIRAFAALGHRINSLAPQDREELINRAGQSNSWFTKESVELSLQGISKFLNEETLILWTSSYNLNHGREKKVGIAMAGNIPLVGFHDFLSVLISGHRLLARLSSQDKFLPTRLAEMLIEIEPRWKDYIRFQDRLNEAEAMIATGSDNTARYFEYYFRNIPHIIRKNRSSCAVIMGEEQDEHLKVLATDVFSYFGLGCRNVSKLYLPEEYDLTRLMRAWEFRQDLVNHHKYANNYDYQKSIMLVNGTPFLDNGCVMITKSESLVSPISVVYYEYYKDQQDLKSKLSVQAEKLQCVVSANGWLEGSIPFGKAQSPDVWDYADGVDTLKFLSAL